MRYSGLPYVFALVQCELWALYAVLTPHMTAPLVTNIIGVLLEVRFLPGLWLSFAMDFGCPRSLSVCVATCPVSVFI